MAALAGQGVTATCSLPGGPRYGYQELDSNLPDFRICLGGPDDNELTARVLAAAGPRSRGRRRRRSWPPTGAARLWLPASRSRADAFGPGADLRGPLDLPVLIVAAADLAAETQRLAADLADAVIEVPPAGRPHASRRRTAAGGPATALAPHTVALLNRGTPERPGNPGWPAHHGADARMQHLAVRSLDRRQEADQPGRHELRLAALEPHVRVRARAPGPGTWRTAGFPAAGQDYNHDLLTVATEPALPGRCQPIPGWPASSRPARCLSALKPHGNPLAPGRPARSAPTASRCGCATIGGAGPVAARVGLFTGLASARRHGLCEDGDGAAAARRRRHSPRSRSRAPAWPRWSSRRLASRPGVCAGGVRPAPLAGPADSLEPAQPVFARYWLHGKGPAPAGNMPVAVHLSPATMALDDGQPGALRLTVACGPAPAAGAVRLEVPRDIALTPAGPLSYDLAPLGYQAWDLTVDRPPRHQPRPPVRHRADRGALGPGHRGQRAAVPSGSRRRRAWTCRCAGAGDAAGRGDGAGGRGRRQPGQPDRWRSGRADPTPSRSLIRNRTAASIRGEAQLISPFGSWRQTSTVDHGLRAGGRRRGYPAFRGADPGHRPARRAMVGDRESDVLRPAPVQRAGRGDDRVDQRRSRVR